MKHGTMLTIASLLSILLFQLHLVDDIRHGMEPGGVQNIVGGTAITLVWLCGTLLLSDRLAGYVIMLLGAILASGVPYLHMSGKGLGGAFTQTPGAFLFTWTLFAMCLSGTFSIVLIVRGLWDLRVTRAAALE